MNRTRLALVAALSGAAGLAHAQVPPAFTAAVSSATTDGAAMAGSLVAVAAAIVIVMIAMKFVKRLKGAV